MWNFFLKVLFREAKDVAPFIGFSYNLQEPWVQIPALQLKAEGSEVQGHPRLHSEFKARVGYKEVPCHADERKESRKGNGRKEGYIIANCLVRQDSG